MHVFNLASAFSFRLQTHVCDGSVGHRRTDFDGNNKWLAGDYWNGILLQSKVSVHSRNSVPLYAFFEYYFWNLTFGFGRFLEVFV